MSALVPSQSSAASVRMKSGDDINSYYKKEDIYLYNYNMMQEVRALRTQLIGVGRSAAVPGVSASEALNKSSKQYTIVLTIVHKIYKYTFNDDGRRRYRM